MSAALYTGGKGRKKMIGRVQWSDDGLKYYKSAEKKCRRMYKCTSLIDIIYRGWEVWLLNCKTRVIAGDSSSKTYHAIMGTWLRDEDDNCSNEGRKKEELRSDSDSDDDDSDDGNGYFSETGTNQCKWDARKKLPMKSQIHNSPSENSTPSKEERELRSDNDDRRKTNTSMEGGTKNQNSTASARKRIGGTLVIEKTMSEGKMGGMGSDDDDLSKTHTSMTVITSSKSSTAVTRKKIGGIQGSGSDDDDVIKTNNINDGSYY